MIPRFDLDTIRFGDAAYLWLLVLPASLLALWGWRLWRRRRDIARFRGQRTVPVQERFSFAGDLGFWFFALLAASLLIVALSRPQAVVSAVRQGSVDLVILQDASASMYVSDLPPDRWRRSVRFLRMLAESLRWQGDRVALALFAQLAAPQVRLTKDPNSLFFFIDSLGEKSPFPLENAPTWDTNIEEGIRWGLRLIEKDEELFGKSGNPKAFIVISDGQSWSGKVAGALTAARQRGIPVHVIGIGTTVGGMIPEPMGSDGVRPRRSSARRSIATRSCSWPWPVVASTSRSARSRTASWRSGSSTGCAGRTTCRHPSRRWRSCIRACFLRRPWSLASGFFSSASRSSSCGTAWVSPPPAACC